MARSIEDRWNLNYRRLVYDGIPLVPVADRDYYPYDLPRNADKWHVPGRLIMSTDALLQLADRLAVSVKLVEHDGEGIQTTRLN